ncbi:MAG TPA: phenylalanine--tRNA ligase subunit beta [Chloroflexota bacterium]|nr:phenylalanine--tRNA ligase subunit beta [Chloroflexota bacterium]
MRVSLKWLRSYTPVHHPVEEIIHRLTMAGTEVADVHRFGDDWSNVYVGQVTRLERHPNADRLLLATVNYGEGRTITVVTGAQNLKVGDRVPLALAGARLLDPHAPEPRPRELKPATIRGIVSEGMVCSARELGLGEDHSGILILDPEARIGAPLAEELGDTILDLDVTPNRSDLLAMVGVAREIAALFADPVTVPVIDYRADGPPADSLVSVRIVDPDLCPRYTAAIVQGVTIAQSPKWMRERLAAAGIRPINNVVDVTNYVMLEWGQPLHAFDYDRIRGRQIVVRRAGDGEMLTLLDGSVRLLTSENLVIADAEGAVAVAGVMGGADSEVTSTTVNVLLESACFNPVSVRRTARSLKLRTDASYRFERGLRPELAPLALRRAVQLLLDVAGGTAASGIVDAYPRPVELPEIFLTPGEVHRVLGLEVPLPTMSDILERLGCRVVKEGDGLRVIPPIQRTDLTIAADLCEEIARVLGYDTIPSTLPIGRQPEPTINEDWRWLDTIRDVMVELGLTEIVTYALTSRERLGRLMGREGRLAGASSFMGPAPALPTDASVDLARAVTERFTPVDVEPVELVNPLSADTECLRTSTFGSMLETLQRNLRLAECDVLLFEIGRIYLPREHTLPEERRMLTVGTGAYRSGWNWGERTAIDFFWLKGIAETLFDRLGLGRRVYRQLQHPLFHPARSAAVLLDQRPEPLIAVLGEVDPEVRAAFDIDQPVFLLGVDLEVVLPLATRQRSIQPIPRFPPVIQDLAIVIGASITADQIAELIRRVGAPLVMAIELFDVYQGPPIPAGKVSLAYHIIYQAPDRTLTDAEVAEVHHRIEQALVGELGVELRR